MVYAEQSQLLPVCMYSKAFIVYYTNKNNLLGNRKLKQH